MPDVDVGHRIFDAGCVMYHYIYDVGRTMTEAHTSFG